ncbi:MAG TPA: uroporphyrinogen-III synthase [Acidimicrobiia bacterium]|nr:uroporphyrinogen-III synthase [Acidimicrobiia bacterium]
MILNGLRVGVTAGRPGMELLDALTRQGAHVVWAPMVESLPTPDPTRTVPPAELLRALCAGELDAVAFASPPEVDGFFAGVASLGLESAVHGALNGTATRVLVAAIGPVTAEALERRGIVVGVCPLQPRIPALATALAAAPLGLRSFGRAEPLLLDHPGRTVTGPGGVVELSDLQFALVASLARRPGLTCPTSVLLREVWGEGPSSGVAARRRLEVLASRLRARLVPIDVHLATVPKRGYRLELDSTPLSAEAPPVR